ncbi:MAG: SH3 domain-containing protein [Paracoccus sp. (in: a-proteobacteria)]
MSRKMLYVTALTTILAAPALAESTTTPITFPAGTKDTAVAGQVAGQDTTDFTVPANQGQRMVVRMTSDNPSSHFNIYAPENQPGQAQALFVGSTSGREANLTLPATGTYVIRTYLVPDAGPQNPVARFSLTVAIDGSIQPAPTVTSEKPKDGTVKEQNTGPDYWQVTGISGRLNIRAKASTSAPVTTTAANGDTLRNKGCKTTESRTWCEVATTTGATGWAASQFLQQGTAPAAESAVQQPDSAPATSDKPTATVSARPPVPAPSKIVPNSGASATPAVPAVSPAKPAPKPDQPTETMQQKNAASGNLPCSTTLGMPTRDCSFSAAQEGQGTATITINRPDGSSRTIHFEKGAPAPHDGQRTERRGNLTVINIGDERYEVPDTVIFGD